MDKLVIANVTDLYLLPAHLFTSVDIKMQSILCLSGQLCGLVVACWMTDHYHLCSNLSVGISESCIIFDFASLPLEVAHPI